MGLTTLVRVLTFALAGWVVAAPFALWTRRDVRSVASWRWVGLGSPDAWVFGTLLGYVCAGWPALVVALAWRTSMTRDALARFRATDDDGDVTLDLTSGDRTQDRVSETVDERESETAIDAARDAAGAAGPEAARPASAPLPEPFRV